MADSEGKDRDGDASSGRRAMGVVVLGPGRSGTSAIARAFVKSGFFAGQDKDLYGPDDGNPLGHFESLAVLRINEELLRDLDGYWWADCPDVEKQLARGDEAWPRMKATLAELVAAAGDSPIVLKEPRINALIPLWLPVLEELLHPVLAVRDPVEVALSHARRDGTSPSHALAAWEIQTALVLRHLEGRTVTVAPYARLMANSEAAEEVVSAAIAHLDPERATKASPAKAGSALSRNLHRQHAASVDRPEYLTGRQAELWDYLESLPLGDVLLENPLPPDAEQGAARAAIRRENERVQMNEAHAALVEANSEMAKRANLSDELEAQLTESRELAAAATARAEHELERADRRTSELEAVRKSASWRLTAPLRCIKSLLGWSTAE
jgi:hypothetical protein